MNTPLHNQFQQIKDEKWNSFLWTNYLNSLPFQTEEERKRRDLSTGKMYKDALSPLKADTVNVMKIAANRFRTPSWLCPNRRNKVPIFSYNIKKKQKLRSIIVQFNTQKFTEWKPQRITIKNEKRFWTNNEMIDIWNSRARKRAGSRVLFFQDLFNKRRNCVL